MSIRLHSQLDGGEKKRTRLEQENEELRVRLQDLEVAKQVLQQEIDKVGTICVCWYACLIHLAAFVNPRCCRR